MEVFDVSTNVSEVSGFDPTYLRELARAWLAEDVGRGDRTSAAVVPVDMQGRARIEARADGVIAGLPVADAVFAQLGDCKCFPEVSEGTRARAGDVLARVEGHMRTILAAERTALNVLQRLSGIATVTARYVQAVAGTSARIVDTRKTTPGLRMLEKYAVTAGGGSNHRYGLDDGILVKDNHISAAGGVHEATRRAVEGASLGLLVEVEVGDVKELEEAIDAGAHAVLLDNMTPDEVASAVEIAAGRVILEASGGIDLENVKEYAEAGVDLISVGALTHSAPALDASLEVESR